MHDRMFKSTCNPNLGHTYINLHDRLDLAQQKVKVDVQSNIRTNVFIYYYLSQDATVDVQSKKGKRTIDFLSQTIATAMECKSWRPNQHKDKHILI